MGKSASSTRTSAPAPAISAHGAALLALIGEAAHTPEGMRGLCRRLTPKQLHEVDQLLGLPPRESLRDFIRRTRPDFVFYRWLEPVLDALQACADGEITRLMINAPPRHGKSELVSRIYPAYWLSLFPYHYVALGSYGNKLADSLSRAARRLALVAGITLSKESKAVSRWETAAGGGMWSTGVGGGTGFGSNLAIIDDPIRDRRSAASPTKREALMDWYEAVFYTRLAPGAPVIIMNTRWHEDDLTGQLLARETTDNPELDALAEGWTILDFPAIAEKPEDRPVYPDTCTVVAEWRVPGEALCPERYPLERLNRIERTVGPSVWASLFQQRPRPRDGSMFKWEWLADVDATHTQAYRVRYWDLAGTDDAGDFTAGTLVAYNPAAPVPIIIEDSRAFKHEPGRRDQLIYETALEDARKYGVGGFHIWIENDPGILGRARTQALVAKLAGFVVYTEAPSGSKVMGAEPLAGQAEIGNVRLLKGDWNGRFREVLCSFPHGKHDDEVDSASGAFRKAVALAGQAWGQERFAIV